MAQSDLLDELLAATSRTFALAIPILPAGLRDQVAIAYLLFRLADTIEDGHFPNLNEKLTAFDRFAELFESPLSDEMQGVAVQHAMDSLDGLEIENPDYKSLVENLPHVVAAWQQMEGTRRDIVGTAVMKSAQGMRKHVAAGDGDIKIETLDALGEYCYFVAGIVGEMLTELFVHDESGLEPVAAQLLKLAPKFGEGLQLVNILKDEFDDESEGRSFVPPNEPRAKLHQTAQADLVAAQEYVQLLVHANANPRLIAFCDLPIQLALPTLQCVAADGPGAKVDRQQVATILADVYARSGILPTENNGKKV